MHAYRTHTCAALRAADAGRTARLSGWVHAKRDHGGLLFLDLRDHYGITQCVFPAGSPAFAQADAARPESVITVTGTVVPRAEGTVNPRLPTGEIELRAEALDVQSAAEVLPIQVAGEEKYPEDLRLTYRFLDLRRDKLHRNMILRAGVIASIRRRMIEAGFTEFTTPILTASSPEGARDFLVPARLHPGKFYALPQAPQQFKQLLMVAGFDRYFQIAPCFRDEASRADRSPGEFYQLDFEMSFVTQDDVFATIEPVIAGVFEEFASGRAVSPAPFVRIPYATALAEFGTDKPDLRNPLRITDVTDQFAGSSFGLFARIAASGGVVRAIPAPGAGGHPRSFFDKLNDWAKEQGAGGLGYITFDSDGAKGPIARNLEPDRAAAIRDACGLGAGDAVFFAAGKPDEVWKFAGAVRTRLGTDLGLVEQGAFRFCWITDFPMYELNEETGQIDFSHNPFSMPQGGLEALNGQDPLTIKAFQ
ncbi:MAG: aspartate--tRNA ligase, partial [Proteobacteria bacterium]|nr:aspartate--tRNA ligase [Pseudomonadota bacterium]